jgi:hypothetical protein
MNEFDNLTKKITLLAAEMTAASKAKTFVQQYEDLRKVLKSARETNWANFISLLEETQKTAKANIELQLQDRRRKLLESLRSKGIYNQMDGEADAVDVFKVRYKGATTIIEFAGVEVESSDELDGEKLANEILAIRNRLEKSRLDRTTFFKFIKNAIQSANAKNPSSDGYAKLDLIYREFLFEQAWARQSFAKSGCSKYFPEYPFYQFLWDLAAFIVGGTAEGEFRLSGRPPAMAERTHSYKLPNLKNPQSPGEVMHLLRIQKKS